MIINHWIFSGYSQDNTRCYRCYQILEIVETLIHRDSSMIWLPWDSKAFNSRKRDWWPIPLIPSLSSLFKRSLWVSDLSESCTKSLCAALAQPQDPWTCSPNAPLPKLLTKSATDWTVGQLAAKASPHRNLVHQLVCVVDIGDCWRG